MGSREHTEGLFIEDVKVGFGYVFENPLSIVYVNVNMV